MKNEVKLLSLHITNQKYLLLLGYSQDHVFKSQELINTIIENKIEYDNTITEKDLINIINTLDQKLKLTKKQENLIRINKEWFYQHGITYCFSNESYPLEIGLGSGNKKYQSPMKRIFVEYLFPILIFVMIGVIVYFINSYYKSKRAKELEIIYKNESIINSPK